MPLFERALRVCYGKPIRQVLEQYRKELEEEELQSELPTGENICIDGGMTKLMIYHDDHGWTYTPEN